MTSRTLHRTLAATAALAWLALGVSLATDWPHHPAAEPANSTTSTTTERVCWRDGTAALVTTLPGGQLLAVSDGTCTYTGPALNDDPEANR